MAERSCRIRADDFLFSFFCIFLLVFFLGHSGVIVRRQWDVMEVSLYEEYVLGVSSYPTFHLNLPTEDVGPKVGGEGQRLMHLLGRFLFGLIRIVGSGGKDGVVAGYHLTTEYRVSKICITWVFPCYV